MEVERGILEETNVTVSQGEGLHLTPAGNVKGRKLLSSC